MVFDITDRFRELSKDTGRLAVLVKPAFDSVDEAKAVMAKRTTFELQLSEVNSHLPADKNGAKHETKEAHSIRQKRDLCSEEIARLYEPFNNLHGSCRELVDRIKSACNRLPHRLRDLHHELEKLPMLTNASITFHASGLEDALDALRVRLDEIAFQKDTESYSTRDELYDISKTNGDNRETLETRKPRGRPSKFSSEQKANALLKMQDGGTYTEIAKILYATQTPSSSQRKNVPAILKCYCQKIGKNYPRSQGKHRINPIS